MMLYLIRFEMYKFLRSKKNMVLSSIFLLICLIYLFLSSSINQKYVQSQKENIEFNTQSIQQELKQLQGELKTNAGKTEIETKLRNYIYNDNIQIKNNNKLLQVLQQNDNMQYLQIKISQDKKLLEDIKNKEIISAETEEVVSKRIVKNEYLLKHHIKPIFEESSTEGLNAISLILQNILPLVFALFVVMFSSDIMSKEFDQGTYKLLFSQPIKRWKVFFSKYIASFIWVSTILFSSLLLVFAIASTIWGIGDISYPVELVSGSMTLQTVQGFTHYSSVGIFIFYGLLLYSLYVLFLVSFSNFVSVYIKNIAISMSITVLTVSIFFVLSGSGLLNVVAHIIPFSYGDVSKVLNGTLSTVKQNNNLTALFGILILIIWTITLNIASLLHLKQAELAK